MDVLNKSIELNANFKTSWIGKSATFYRMRKLGEAMGSINKALQINKNFPVTLRLKGLILFEMGKYNDALKYCNKAIKNDPNHELGREVRNLILIRLGKIDEALVERDEIYFEKMKEIEDSKLSDEEKEEKIILEDAKREVLNDLRNEYKSILDAKKVYDERLNKSLKPRNKFIKNNFILILRRWNSYTPTMLTTTESNLGGGYFIYWQGKGIVIDPGFDFLDNFFNNNLVIDDIDAIIITHAHIDHCADFESILTLLHEFNERNKVNKKIDVFINLGVLKKCLGWLSLNENEEHSKIKRIYPLERNITYDLDDYNFTIKVTSAIHNEILSKDYSVGLILNLYGENGYSKRKPFKIGYTSDTRHDDKIVNQYKNVDIIIPHLGSIEDNDFIIEDDKRNENHLMLKGVIATIYSSNAKLAIISEFGEELEEYRIRIVGALNTVFLNNKMAKCLTGDIGLNVQIPNLKIKCNYCHNYRSLNRTSEALDPVNQEKKSVIYFCKNCKKAYDDVIDKI